MNFSDISLSNWRLHTLGGGVILENEIIVS